MSGPEDQQTAADAGAGLSIRRLTELDTALLADLEAYGRAALGDSALDHWLLPVIAAHGFLFIGSSAGDIVGAAEIIRSLEESELYMEGFYIRPGYQGRGYGAALLAGVCDSLAGAGFRRLLATVDPGNLAGCRLYERAGFTRVSDLPDHYGAGRHRSLLSLKLVTG
ncbi:MAG: GNAT family N-acetyltransferase [Thermoleophilia bacterium]